MSDALKLDKNLKELYVSTCSDALRKILHDRGLVQPLSRTIIIGRIWYDLREEVRDHLSEIVSKVQEDIPDEESRVTGILVVYHSFFYLVVEGSDEALSDILHGMADAVREGVVLKAKVVRTGGIVDRFFNHYHTCVVNTPRYEEEEFLEEESSAVKKSAFFDDTHISPTTRRKSLFSEGSMSLQGNVPPSRPSSADGDLGRRSISLTNESNLRRKSRFIDDTALSVGRKSSFTQSSKLSLSRRKSSFAQGSKQSLSGRKSSLAQGSKQSLSGRKSSLAQGSKLSLSGRKSSLAQGSKLSLSQGSDLSVRRKSRFADIIIKVEDKDEDDDVSLIARMLFKLEEVVFVLASCIRYVRPEEVESRLNELLPTGVLLNGEELSDLWREDFFLDVEEHIDRYFTPLSHTSFLEEEWPPTGPAHDPNGFLEEISRYEKQVDLDIEEEWRKKPR